MAHTSRLTSWLLANAERLKLSAHRYTWPDEWLPGYYDFHVSIEVGGKQFAGSGLSLSEDEAFLKAGAEALERCIHASTGRANTNGLAVHELPAAAQKNALEELIERDAFFCHFLTKIPFAAVSNEALQTITFDLGKLSKRLETFGVELHLGRMTAPEGLVGIVCSIDGAHARHPFGIRIGLGCKEQAGGSIEHAVLEAMKRSVRVIEGGEVKRLTKTEFLALPTITVADHDALALDIEASGPARTLFAAMKGEQQGHACSTDSIGFHHVRIPQDVQDAPLVACYADSLELQGAFFGRTTPNVVNISRLQLFAGRSLSWDDIDTAPHVFG